MGDLVLSECVMRLGGASRNHCECVGHRSGGKAFLSFRERQRLKMIEGEKLCHLGRAEAEVARLKVARGYYMKISFYIFVATIAIEFLNVSIDAPRLYTAT